MRLKCGRLSIVEDPISSSRSAGCTLSRGKSENESRTPMVASSMLRDV